ncbi:DUF4326 domain-containing protein [Vibrio sp. TH_r3]|uniref:DUF4326 domain-containing protein n=1 Tax=Vibrio sp. TH_r3 TaxID=3082084 RepID=UPI002952E3B4|nr:DUF4326 domain-containing protein [Vibrio sp. TH_r3]MDV7106031.1 DUF4326 domain-containing protein [Vibrio sp. TH_r3]
MNSVLVLYPNEFNCQSKLTRKLVKITKNMSVYNLVSIDDAKGLLMQYSHEYGIDFTLLKDTDFSNIEFTHAVVFDDGESFTKEIHEISELAIPLRLIKIAVTRVINIKNGVGYSEQKSTPNYEYIGRGSYWGNPHSMYETMEDSEEDPRDAVIRMYKYDFDYNKFLNIEKNKVYELAGKRLGCFCKPYACHGDVLADFLNQWDDGE